MYTLTLKSCSFFVRLEAILVCQDFNNKKFSIERYFFNLLVFRTNITENRDKVTIYELFKAYIHCVTESSRQ